MKALVSIITVSSYFLNDLWTDNPNLLLVGVQRPLTTNLHGDGGGDSHGEGEEGQSEHLESAAEKNALIADAAAAAVVVAFGGQRVMHK